MRTCVLCLAAVVLSAGCTGVAYRATEGTAIADASGPGMGGAPLLSRLAGAELKHGESFIAARGGFVFSGRSDAEVYNGIFTMGAFYPFELPGIFGLDTIPCEAGFDLAWVESDDGDEQGDLFLLRFDCLFSTWNAVPPVPDFYGVGGLQIIRDTNNKEGVMALDLGGGAAWPEIGLDARLTWAILMGSENLKALWLLTCGYTF